MQPSKVAEWSAFACNCRAWGIRASVVMNTEGTRNAIRWVLAALYALAGVLHLIMPQPFLGILPPWVPFPQAVIAGTGIAELAGAIAIIQPLSARLRVAGGIGLALYAICVFPANIHHFALDMARPGHGAGLAYHIPRMALQPVLVWLALWSVGAVRRPGAASSAGADGNTLPRRAIRRRKP